MGQVQVMTSEWPCGILQVNLGYHYISQTLENLKIEPGIHCISHIERMDHKATHDKLRKNSFNFKRQRANYVSRS